MCVFYRYMYVGKKDVNTYIYSKMCMYVSVFNVFVFFLCVCVNNVCVFMWWLWGVYYIGRVGGRVGVGKEIWEYLG